MRCRHPATSERSPCSTSSIFCAPAPTGGANRGQATTEYALVLLAAALVGVLVIGWATTGGGAAAIGRLFDSVIDSVIDQV